MTSLAQLRGIRCQLFLIGIIRSTANHGFMTPGSGCGGSKGSHNLPCGSHEGNNALPGRGRGLGAGRTLQPFHGDHAGLSQYLPTVKVVSRPQTPERGGAGAQWVTEPINCNDLLTLSSLRPRIGHRRAGRRCTVTKSSHAQLWCRATAAGLQRGRDQRTSYGGTLV